LTATSQYDEKRLLLEMAAGDEDAFDGIYQHYRLHIYNYVLKIVKSPQLAEDLQQEIFVKIWETRGTLPGVRAFGPFLFSVARNHTINAMKSVARSNMAMGEILKHFPEPGFDNEILHRDYERYIQKVLQSLPERTREIYRNCREQGKTYKEVAEDLGISSNAVKRHIVNSIRTLKDAVQKDLGLSPDMIILLLALIDASSN
jgi:RNA polymerase sigma-70 factor (ECF subfamily)